MNEIDNWMNWLSDQDWSWWPLKSMRPLKNSEIDDLRLLKMSCAIAPLMAVLILIPSWGMTNLVGLKLIVSVLGLTFGSFFLVYKLTFAYAWNRRARRLRSAFEALKVGAPRERESLPGRRI
jgi:hypothetical protein